MLGVTVIVNPGLARTLRGVFAILRALGLSVSLGLGLLGGAICGLSSVSVGASGVRFGILAFLGQSSSRSLQQD
jgi:hypothetical protein